MAAYPQSNPLMGHGHAHPHTRTHMQSYPLNGTHSYPLNGTHSYPLNGTHSYPLNGTHSYPFYGTHSYPFYGTHTELLSLWDTYGVTLSMGHIRSYPLNGTHSYPFYVTHSELLSLWDTYGVTLSMGHTQTYPFYGTHPELPSLWDTQRVTLPAIEPFFSCICRTSCCWRNDRMTSIPPGGTSYQMMWLYNLRIFPLSRQHRVIRSATLPVCKLSTLPSPKGTWQWSSDHQELER